MQQKHLDLLAFIYDDETAASTLDRLQQLVDSFRQELDGRGAQALTHKDTILITYGDMVQEENLPHLKTLNRFLTNQIADVVSTVHLLPFYSWSSDDGFSVIDYLEVDPPLGNWHDVGELRCTFRLMFDAVINHISQKSDWFQRYLNDEAPYSTFFKAVDPEIDLSAVFRPRALPLLTSFETKAGTKHFWTTFSADQIDLNYESPDLLLEVIKVLLTYVAYGADIIRLDAIGFMWKVPGTRSLHLPQTHALIQLMRAVLDDVAPHVALITETNVPHIENVSYFGDGFNEAQMVYNFSLPPLLLHAFHTGDASHISKWAAALTTPSRKTTFFNFCASHDGIGVTPARGILPDSEIDQMAERVEALGGRVSYKANSDGSQSAYELNINYLTALGDPCTSESNELKATRFLTSQAVMLALRGVPGIYFHSLFGSESWADGVSQLGHNRAINRQKLDRQTLESELTTGLRAAVFRGYKQLLYARRTSPAFDPYGEQEILQLHSSVIGIVRRSEDETVWCLHNVSSLDVRVLWPGPMDVETWRDLISGYTLPNRAELTLTPYQSLWLHAQV